MINRVLLTLIFFASVVVGVVAVLVMLAIAAFR